MANCYTKYEYFHREALWYQAALCDRTEFDVLLLSGPRRWHFQFSNHILQCRFGNITCSYLVSGDIKDLLESFKENGYLKIDNIIVRPLDDSKEQYLVVEGNRRITTLKVFIKNR